MVEIEDTQPAQIEGCKPLIEALLKDGTCYAFPDPEGIQSTFDGYVETTVEGENANAIRSFITMDGTLDQFSQLGGVLAFSENLSNSLGLDAKQVQIVKVEQGSVIVVSDILSTEEMDLAQIEAKLKSATVDGELDLGLPILDVSTGVNG